MGVVEMANFKELMAEKKEVNRWFVTSVFIGGAFCGALLTVAFIFIALGQ